MSPQNTVENTAVVKGMPLPLPEYNSVLHLQYTNSAYSFPRWRLRRHVNGHDEAPARNVPAYRPVPFRVPVNLATAGPRSTDQMRASTILRLSCFCYSDPMGLRAF